MESFSSSYDLLKESEVLRYCRVCLCKKDSLRDIFDSNSLISARVHSCTGLQIVKQDNYPNRICNECLESLFTSWQFKNSCHRSEKWLKQFIQIGNLELTNKTIIDKLCELGTTQTEESDKDRSRFFDSNFEEKKVEDVFVNVDNDYNQDDDDDRHQDDFEMSYTDLSTKPEKTESNEYEDFYSSENISSLNKKNDAVKDEADSEANGESVSYNFRRTTSFPSTSDSSTFKCTECPKSFDFQGTLSYHMRLYHGIELPDETKKESLRQSLLQKKPVKKKSLSQNGPKESKSAVKITVPPLPSVDVDHKLLNEKAGFKCEVCKKAFMRRHHVIKHLKYHLLDGLFTQEKLDIAVEKVNKKFEAERRAMEATPGAGRWGGRRKEKDSPVMCSLCNKMYPSEKKLQVHMGNVHRPHKICEVCGEPYKNTEHLRIHLPPRFACDMCDYRGVRKIDIIRHIATHGAPKEFKCDQCPAEFHIKGNLNRHYEIRHCTGLPFQCDQCERAFKVRRYLTEHINTVHRQIKKSHQCGVCMMKYVKRGSWRKHMVRVHGITPPKERLGRKRTAIVLQEHQVDLPRIGRPQYTNPRSEPQVPGWDLSHTQPSQDWTLMMGPHPTEQ